MDRKKSKNSASGFALMEVLIAMFVLAVGILGAGAIQTIGLQANQGAYLRSQAIFLAGEMADHIRANRTARSSYMGVDTKTDSTASPSCISTASGCNAANVAAADIAEWVAKIKSGDYLPGARGKIEDLAAGDNVKITITWGETDWNAGVRDEVGMSYVITAAVNPGDH